MIQDDDIPLFSMPDFDDTLIRLSDLIMMHKICRRRTCRHNEGCQGGFGPPCYLHYRHHFVDAVRTVLRSQTFHHRRLEFSVFDQGDGLATSPDFVSTIGDLFPMAPWGRSSL
jgi:hypothetical protein